MGRLNKQDIQSIVGSRNIQTAVETGLWKGKQLEVIAELFELSIGIELDEHYYNLCSQKFADNPNVAIFQGDSRRHLKHICDTTKEPAVFFLDAHYCKLDPPIERSEFPLWDELKIISERPYDDIVIVDDVHTFGKERPDLQYKEGDKEWESVNEQSLMTHFKGCENKIIKDSFVIWKK